jgi:uridylate kinase
MTRFAELYRADKAVSALERGEIVLLAGGSGNPFFTTDTAAALRAAELGADAVFKGTTVDGVYDADPRKNPDARLIKDITYRETIEKGLKVMDTSAFQLCLDQRIPVIRIFNMDDLDNVLRVAKGEDIGTVVHL